MLLRLAWNFEFDARGLQLQLKQFCGVAIDLIPRVLLPLGEGLMLRPAGNKYPGQTAGPGFGLTRHVMLPPSPVSARELCCERLKELAAIAGNLRGEPVPKPVTNGCEHLREIAENLYVENGS
jgi:hypothetical protein